MLESTKQKDLAIIFDSISVSLDGNKILEDICATVPRGVCTAIVGPNGAGKTTLLLALLGNIAYTGKISFVNNSRKPIIGYVPQRLQFDRGMPLTVLEFIVMGKQRLPLCFGISSENRFKALEYLAAVEAEKLLNRRLGALSAGELQRVLLALALVQEPELLILDEPAVGVDMHGEQLFCELLEHLREERGFTQLMVSHDLSIVTHHAKHVICLNRKLVAEGTPKDVLNVENLTAIFGLHMGLVAKNSLYDGKTECSCCDRRKNNA